MTTAQEVATPAPPVRIEIALSDEAGIYETSTYTDPRSAQDHLDKLATTEEQTGQRWPGTVVIQQGTHVTIQHIDGDNDSWLDQTVQHLIDADDAATALTAMIDAGWYSIDTAEYGRWGWQCTAYAATGPDAPQCDTTPTAARMTGGGIRLNVPRCIVSVTGIGATASEAIVDAHRYARRVSVPAPKVAA